METANIIYVSWVLSVLDLGSESPYQGQSNNEAYWIKRSSNPGPKGHKSYTWPLGHAGPQGVYSKMWDKTWVLIHQPFSRTFFVFFSKIWKF